MQNRLEFVQSLKQYDIKEAFIRFFVETMALYNIVHDYNLNDRYEIIQSNYTEDDILFSVCCKCQEDAEEINNVLNNQIMSIYNMDFTIDCSIKDLKVLISLHFTKANNRVKIVLKNK